MRGMESTGARFRDKRQFANRAIAFAKRAGRFPRFPLFELNCLAAVALAAISGPFGTAALGWPQRTLFWFILIAWAAAKWRVWFAWRVRDRADWIPASATGAILLNLPLPFEIELVLQLVGAEARIGRAPVWLAALGISAVVLALILALRWLIVPPARPEPPRGVGPLARSGIRIEQVAAVRAEDHYCRVCFADGSTRLVLCRLGDAVAELAGLDGARIHRGAWVADWAVDRAERTGRAWRVVAAGQTVAVSAAHVAEARRRGWLNRR